MNRMRRLPKNAGKGALCQSLAVPQTHLLRLGQMLLMSLLCTVLLLGLVASADATSVVRVGTWSQTQSASLSYTPGAGSDRVILVAVTGEDSNQSADITQVSYGGQLVTEIGRAVRGAGYSNIAWLGFCNETCIAAAVGTSLSVSTSSGNLDNEYVLAAGTYENVDQTQPIYAYNGNTSGSSTVTASLNVAANNRVVYVTSFNQASGTSTPSSGFTNVVNHGAGGNSHTMIVDERTATTAATPLSISTTFGSTSSRTAIVAVSLLNVQCAATAPSDLASNEQQGGTVVLTWTYDSTNNDFYTVYRDGSVIGTSTGGSFTDDYRTVVPALVPSTAYTYTVRGTNNATGCESGASNAVVETTAACFSNSGPIAIASGQTLSGASVDLTALVNANGATLSNYSVNTLLAPALNELESFSAGDPKGWSYWTPDNLNNPPANRDLHTGISTLSDGTGPGTSPNGSFLYYETSEGGDTLRYLTHNSSLNADNNELSVSFKYNMNGLDIGSLDLEVSQNAGVWTSVWNKVGNQSDVWTQQTVDLEALGYTSGTVDLRFKFAYGSGFLGDIALDEVKLFGPGRAGTLQFSGTPAPAAAADTTAGPVWPDATELRLDVAGTDNCGTALADIGTFMFYVDNIAPTVTAFVLPGSAVSPVSVSTLLATDNIGVSGYMVTETPAAPGVNDAGWLVNKPIRITTASVGPVTFYAWAKDAAGNVSSSRSALVTVAADATPPVVTSFTLPAASFAPVLVDSFSATDDSGLVTGYMITENATPPTAGDAGWLASPPASISPVGSGAVTFYAWAKDSAGNVSAPVPFATTVKVDSNPPVVTFTLPATATSKTITVTAFGAVDNVPDVASNTGVAGYMITESGVDADPTVASDPRWLGSPQFSIIASTTGAVTFKAWAKDNAGNISSSVSQSITITLPASCDYDIAPFGTYIEAEHFTSMGASNPWAWAVVTTPLADNSGDLSSEGYLNTTVGGTGTQPNGSRTDYPVNFTSGGTYCLWVRALDAAGTGGGDSTFWGIDGTSVGAITEAADNQWAWADGVQNGSNCTSIAAGAHTINLWPREAGQKTDAFVITTSTGTPAYFSGNNDLTATKASLQAGGVKTSVDPTCVDASGGGAPGGGGGSNYIHIPDGQNLNGNPLNVENLYSTDVAGTRQYRMLGKETDGFNGFSLASKWSKTDVGGDTTGAPLLVNQQLQLSGGGQDIWGNSDAFSYLYQGGKTGDFTIDVNVLSIQNTNSWAKAGLMVRQSLANNSPHASIYITPGSGVSFQRRVSSGGSTSSTSAGGQSAPKWLRLKRIGNVFYAYYSNDGSSWVLVGNATVNMSGTVNAGLAVTSHNTSLECNAVFDNFLYMPAGFSGMSEGWNNTSTASPGSVDTGNWASGEYGVSVRTASVGPESNTFSYNNCIDATPSTLQINDGQKVGGSAVSLNGLFVTTGNISSFRYQLNGVDEHNPWNSFSVVGSGSSSPVTFTVIGTDPDCGGTSISHSAVINVDNSCIDSTPSTITILTGQSSGGADVDLTQMVSSTGNVAGDGFTYKINGNVIGNPAAWDSRAFGITTPEAVTLEVIGVDSDCNNAIAAINLIEIDNACVFNPPSIVLNQSINYVGAGRAVPYTLTVRNENSYNCGAATLTVTMDSDDNSIDFAPSYFPSPSTITDPGFTISPTSATVTLLGRHSAKLELAVTAKAGATEWNINNTQLSVTADSGNNSTIASTKVFLVSPITHNSVTTNSAKWGGTVDADGNTLTQGEWGTSQGGSKYGNFDCLTCHQKDGPNIKWLKGEIHLPGATWGTGTTSADLPIVFKDARPVTGDWGNDDPLGLDVLPFDTKTGVGRTGSTRPCEVCHTQTMHHRNDTTGQTDGLAHFPDRDCTDCHRHSIGFTASCTGCHGNPPLSPTLGGPNGLAAIPGPTGSSTPGAHYKHVKVLGFPCEYCHSGWRDVGEMPDTLAGTTSAITGKPYQQINHKFDIFGRQASDVDYAVATTGHYTGQDGVNYEIHADQVAAGNQLADGTIPSGKGTLTCENIYCHGGTDTMGGTNPQWNGNVTCNSCHGTSASNTPPGYSHTTHVGKMGLACTTCHGDGTINPLPGSNGHVNGSVGWDLTAAPYIGSPATYKGSTSGETGHFAPSSSYDGYGTCSNVACHFGTTTPVWNNGSPATCTTCHNDGTNDGLLKNAAPLSGEHNAHVRPATGTLDETMVNAFINKCESCHGGGANTGAQPGHLGSAHATSPVNVNDYVDFGGMTYDSGTQTCTSLCHEADEPGIWGSNTPLSCEACHRAPYLGPTVVDPNNEGTGMAASGFGSHLKISKGEVLSGSTNWKSQCQQCHPYHAGGSFTVPLPPTSWDNPGTAVVETENMAYKLGLQFPVTGGIHLGGTATSGTDEADICWNCHGTDTEINEWGYNADTNGPSYPQVGLALESGTAAAVAAAGHTYWDNGGASSAAGGSHNYGYLQTSNQTSGNYPAASATSKWVDGSGWGNYRRDAYQHSSASTTAYRLSRRITSVHSVNFDPAKDVSSVATAIDASGNVVAAAQETPDSIRCSYCHDVHDRNKAFADVAAGINETQTGRPFLRGSWMGNPYPPDMPPLSTYESAYDSTGNDNHYSSNGRTFNSGYDTPRLFSNSATSQMKGGYFLDANSGRPTEDPSYDSLEETAGLCVACHGADVNNMDFYPNSGSYAGYTNTKMWRTDQVNGHANSTLAAEGATHANARNIFDAKRGQSYRVMGHQSGVAQGQRYGKDHNFDSGPYYNGMDKAFETSNPTLRVSGWYGGTPQSDPSSRPTGYATWYYGSTSATQTLAIGTDGSGSGRAHSFTCSKCHSPHATGLPALLITNCLDKSVSSYAQGSGNPSVSQATNCHRKEGTTTGWNRLAPAQ